MYVQEDVLRLRVGNRVRMELRIRPNRIEWQGAKRSDSAPIGVGRFSETRFRVQSLKTLRFDALSSFIERYKTSRSIAKAWYNVLIRSITTFAYPTYLK